MSIACILKKMVRLDRSFQKVLVDPPSVDETITRYCNNIKPKYEEYHNVIYSQDALMPV